MVFFRDVLLVVFTLYRAEIIVALKSFYGQEICINEEELVNLDCIQKVTTPRAGNNVECAVKCWENNDCVGFSVDDATKTCFHHYGCSVVGRFTCGTGTGVENQHLFFSKHCDNGGQWQPSAKACKCAKTTTYEYWVGENCDRYPYYCKEILLYGYRQGRNNMMVDLERNGKPILAFCYVFTNQVSYKVLDYYGHRKTNQTWNNYKDGFSGYGTHFLGFRGWSVISQLGANTVDLEFNLFNIGSMTRRYFGFKIHNESDNYSFTFNSSALRDTSQDDVLRGMGFALDDCLGPYQNTPFSTWDRDHDGNAGINCASTRGSGWWLGQDCNPYCNPLGDQPRFWYSGQPLVQRMTVPGYNVTVMETSDMSVKLFALLDY